MKCLNFMLILMLATQVLGYGLSNLQSDVKNLNTHLKDAGVPQIGSVQIKIDTSITEDMLPTAKVSADGKIIFFQIHKNHFQKPELLILFVQQAIDAVAYPLNLSNKYKEQRTIHSLFFSAGNDGTYLNLLDEANNSHDVDILKLRQTARLQTFIEDNMTYPERIKKLMSGLGIGNLQLDLKKFEKPMSVKLNWMLKRIYNFSFGLGSDQMQKMIAHNDRAGVANLLTTIIPFQSMTTTEKNFWQTQIDAIKNPRSNPEILVSRGGEYFKKTQTAVSNAVQQKPLNKQQGIPKFQKKTLLSTGLGLISIFYSHSRQTSSQFISTTSSDDIAYRFSERSGTLSILQIDPRRLIPVYIGYWKEAEYLVPLIIFPDEIVESSNGDKQKAFDLAEKYKWKIQNTDELLKKQSQLSFYFKTYGVPNRCINLF